MFVKLEGIESAWFESTWFEFLRPYFSPSKTFLCPAFFNYVASRFLTYRCIMPRKYATVDKIRSPLEVNQKLPCLVTCVQLIMMVLGGFVPMPPLLLLPNNPLCTLVRLYRLGFFSCLESFWYWDSDRWSSLYLMSTYNPLIMKSWIPYCLDNQVSKKCPRQCTAHHSWLTFVF